MDKLTEKIAQELTVDMIPDGIWKTVAMEIGPVNLIKTLVIINGTSTYIPKPDRILAPARDKCVRKEFNGYNHDALAKKYGLSTDYVRRLCGREEVPEQTTLFQSVQNLKSKE